VALIDNLMLILTLDEANATFIKFIVWFRVSNGLIESAKPTVLAQLIGVQMCTKEISSGLCQFYITDGNRALDEWERPAEPDASVP
jgi:hypothetical protein